MVDWNHIDCVVDIRHQTQLDASFDHSPDEVVGIRDCDGGGSSVLLDLL